jgi:hypothetical protein
MILVIIPLLWIVLASWPLVLIIPNGENTSDICWSRGLQNDSQGAGLEREGEERNERLFPFPPAASPAGGDGGEEAGSSLYIVASLDVPMWSMAVCR